MGIHRRDNPDACSPLAGQYTPDATPRALRVVRRVVSTPITPEVEFIPYRDYDIAEREITHDMPTPSDWEAVAYTHEARLNGYKY